MLITTTTPTITEWKCKLLVDNYLISTQVINSVGSSVLLTVATCAYIATLQCTSTPGEPK